MRSDEDEDDVQIRRRPRATRRAVRIISEPSSASEADDESPSDDDDEDLATLRNRLIAEEATDAGEEADVPVRSPRTTWDSEGGRNIERAYSFTAHSPNGPPCMVDADGLKKVQAALEHLGATYSVSIERGPVCGTLHHPAMAQSKFPKYGYQRGISRSRNSTK